VESETRIDRGVPYGQGKRLDIYRQEPAGGGPAPTVLLWHGVGPDERDVLETLAVQAAGYGLTVVAPDWRSDAPDGGRAHLLGSLDFTRERTAGLGGLADDAIVLAGWSRGGRSAAAAGGRPLQAGRHVAGQGLVGGWVTVRRAEAVVVQPVRGNAPGGA